MRSALQNIGVAGAPCELCVTRVRAPCSVSAVCKAVLVFLALCAPGFFSPEGHHERHPDHGTPDARGDAPRPMQLLLSALLGLTPHSAEVGRRSVLLGALASAAPSPAVAAHTQPPNYFMPSSLRNSAAPGAWSGPAKAALAEATVFGVTTDGTDQADLVKMQTHLAFKSISTSRALCASRVRRLAATHAATHRSSRPSACSGPPHSPERCVPAAGLLPKRGCGGATLLPAPPSPMPPPWTLQVSGRAP